ncbi:MAG: hypothetical protein HZY75_13210 [Nocardioidaceae bacterium]|nr:MAG: hypothetical protein HZY75_13210 [Nocardioidaceae bacterium]
MTTLLPTVPGYVTGIVDTDPLTLQCGACGALAVKTGDQSTGAFMVLSDFRFCRNEHPHGVRRCKACREDHKTECARCKAND